MPLKYNVFENIMENGAFFLCANAPFSIINSKVIKTLLKFFFIFYLCYLKNENDVMIKNSLWSKGLNLKLQIVWDRKLFQVPCQYRQLLSSADNFCKQFGSRSGQSA